MGCQAETLSLLPQVTLEDAGTISFQVGSCSSEAQLKVTGGQSPPMPGKVMSPYSSLFEELLGVVRSETRLLAVILPWGALGVQFSNP